MNLFKKKKKVKRIHFECWFEPYALDNKSMTEQEIAEQYAKLILNNISDYKSADSKIHYTCHLQTTHENI